MTDEPRRAVLYRRVSTRDQGLGLAAQEQQLREEADRRGWTPELVTDKGVSGRIPAGDRAALGPALDSLRPGDVLAVAKLDRLSRSVFEFARVLERAEREGWTLAVLDLGIDTTTHHGRLVAHIIVAIAEWEREMISIRIREGMARSTKRMGRAPGLPPVGGGKPAIVSEGVLAVVRDAQAEGLSARATARRLNEYGHASPRGGRWHATTVLRLLDRAALA